MIRHLILTVVTDDKPGIIRSLANVVSKCSGNWLESRLTRFAGKFAGVIRISINEDQTEQLEAELTTLTEVGIRVVVEPADPETQNTATHQTSFTAVGPDRPGIVLEISQAFTRFQINIEHLSTHCSSMPYSGDPLFEATGMVTLTSDADWDRLTEQLDTIADSLGIDIRLEELTDIAPS